MVPLEELAEERALAGGPPGGGTGGSLVERLAGGSDLRSDLDSARWVVVMEVRVDSRAAMRSSTEAGLDRSLA